MKNPKLILGISNLSALILLLYVGSFLEERPEFEYTNQVAEFLVDPVGIFWLLSSLVIVTLFMLSED